MQTPVVFQRFPLKELNIFVWAALVLLHLALFGWQLYKGPITMPDGFQYLHASENLREHGALYCEAWEEPLQPRAMTLRPPFYPFLILCAQILLQGSWGILLVQVVLSLLNLYGVVWLWRQFGVSDRYQWALLLLVLLFPAQALYSNLVLTEMLTQTLVLLLFGAMFLFWKTQRKRYAVSAAAGGVLAMLTKPLFYPFSLVFLGWSCFQAFRLKKWVLVAVGFLPFAVAWGYQFYNEQRTGYFHFSTIAEDNLLSYNAYGMLEAQQGTRYADSLVAAVEQQAALQPSFAQQQRYIRQQGMALIAESPVAYGLYHLKGVVHFFLDPGRSDLVFFFGTGQAEAPVLTQYIKEYGYGGIFKLLGKYNIFFLLLLASIVVGNGLKVLALLLFACNRRLPLEVRLLLLLLVGYVAVLAGPVGASRFVVPVFPLLLFTVPFAWEQAKVWLPTWAKRAS